jgi:hypothetical protein
MNHMMLIARSAGLVCARFIVLFRHISKVLGSILQILGKLTRPLTCGFVDVLCHYGTLTARALKGAHTAPLTRRAQWVAFVIGISLSVPLQVADGGSQRPIQSIRQLADKQLTEVQELCHNAIVYRESRFDRHAVNGSHHGYYQGRSKYLKGKPDDVQFYWMWHYVANRYGVTRYDEPDYCKALHHLRVKGWQ